MFALNSRESFNFLKELGTVINDYRRPDSLLLVLANKAQARPAVPLYYGPALAEKLGGTYATIRKDAAEDFEEAITDVVQLFIDQPKPLNNSIPVSDKEDPIRQLHMGRHNRAQSYVPSCSNNCVIM